MATNDKVRRFIDALATHAQGVTLMSQLLDAVDQALIPRSAVVTLIDRSTERWLLQTQLGLPDNSALVAVECVRKSAGAAHGFPGSGRKLPQEILGPVHYVVQDFETVRRFHLEIEALVSETLIELESCSPADLSEAVAGILEQVQQLSIERKSVVRPHASMGSPEGVIWSTPNVIDPLAASGTPIANRVRNRVGLIDSHWENGRGLFRYSIDSERFGNTYRPTPIEGGNRRFRLTPHVPENFAPFGATVDLEALKESLDDGGKTDDDGVPECVSAPFHPDASLWVDLIRDLRFAGAMSFADDLPQSTDADFQMQILRRTSSVHCAERFRSLLEVTGTNNGE